MISRTIGVVTLLLALGCAEPKPSHHVTLGLDLHISGASPAVRVTIESAVGEMIRWMNRGLRYGPYTIVRVNSAHKTGVPIASLDFRCVGEHCTPTIVSADGNSYCLCPSPRAIGEAMREFGAWHLGGNVVTVVPLESHRYLVNAGPAQVFATSDLQDAFRWLSPAGVGVIAKDRTMLLDARDVSAERLSAWVEDGNRRGPRTGDVDPARVYVPRDRFENPRAAAGAAMVVFAQALDRVISFGLDARPQLSRMLGAEVYTTASGEIRFSGGYWANVSWHFERLTSQPGSMLAADHTDYPARKR